MIKILSLAANAISGCLFLLLRSCYGLSNSYILALIFFTVLTKLMLFPVSLWTHRNSLKMVALMPELNRLKIKYYGDKDTVAEEMQALYKREGYHPLASTIPIAIQLVLPIGVIGAVRELLVGTESMLRQGWRRWPWAWPRTASTPSSGSRAGPASG